MEATKAPTESIESRQNGSRPAHIVLLVSTLLLLAMCAVRAVVSWRHDANMDHVAGVWTTLAQDLLRGVFYRPISGPLGYGGTRYMPAFFVLQAGIWKAFASWRVAGHLICGASVVAIVAGVYVFLRKFAVGRAVAVGAAVVALAGAGGKYALLDIRADGLAAALNLWGVIVMIGAGDDVNAAGRKTLVWLRVVTSTLLFTLAFATKVTSVFGVAAVVLWMLLARRVRLAVVLAGATAVGGALTLVLTNVFSDVRFLQILRATATGGGSGSFVFTSPVRLAEELTMSAPDALLLIGAVAVLLAAGRRVWLSLRALFFATTLLVTLVIFGSPGTVGNHLVDLEIVCAIVIAVTGPWEGGEGAFAQHGRSLVAYALSALMVVATLHYFQEFRDVDTESMRNNYSVIEEAVKATGKPALAEQPLIPIDSGQRPYVLDPFMFRVFAQRDARLAQPLWEKIDRKAFGAIVLEYDPRNGEGQYVYESVHFGPPFIERLTANYEFVKQVGDLYVWKPKGTVFPEMND